MTLVTRYDLDRETSQTSVLPNKLAGENAGYGLPALIPPAMRAVPVTPGTRVDVLLTGNSSGAGAKLADNAMNRSRLLFIGILALTLGALVAFKVYRSLQAKIMPAAVDVDVLVAANNIAVTVRSWSAAHCFY